MRSLRPRMLVATAAAAALALSVPGAASAGDGPPVRDAKATPSTVTLGEVSTITPDTEEDGCQTRFAPTDVGTAGDDGPIIAADYSVVPQGGDESIDKDSEPVDEFGQWSIDIDTSDPRYAPGVYEVDVRCTILFPADSELLAAGFSEETVTVYNTVLVTVVEPAAPPAPTPPPATEAEAITAAPTFTG